ncbi:MAG: HDOD domain-containing protein [Verrucomicrobiota bacterium]
MSPPPPPPTLDQVCAQALRLPCAPSLMPRLIAVLRDDASGANEIEDIIQLDPALTAATLRLANSAFFGAGQTVETVAQAVIRVGQREIYRLAALALVNRWEASTGAYGGDPGDFCRHALCTALAAEVLAEAGSPIDPESAYTAGLVCDIGKLAVAHACAAFFPAIRARQADQVCAWKQAERDVLGYDYAQVGAQLLRTWRFPAVYAVAAEFCHEPAGAPSEAQPLLALLHAAKYLATSLGLGVSEDGFLFAFNAPFVAAHGYTPELLERSMVPVMERAVAHLRDKATHGSVSF